MGPEGWKPPRAHSIICLFWISTTLEVSVSSFSGHAGKIFPALLLATCQGSHRPSHHPPTTLLRGSPSSDLCPSCSRCCPLCPARQPPAPKGPTQSDSPTLRHKKPSTPPSTAERPPESQDLPSITPQRLQQLPRDPKLPYSFPSRPPDTLGWDKRFLDTAKMSLTESPGSPTLLRDTLRPPRCCWVQEVKQGQILVGQRGSCLLPHTLSGAGRTDPLGHPCPPSLPVLGPVPPHSWCWPAAAGAHLQHLVDGFAVHGLLVVGGLVEGAGEGAERQELLYADLGDGMQP